MTVKQRTSRQVRHAAPWHRASTSERCRSHHLVCTTPQNTYSVVGRYFCAVSSYALSFDSTVTWEANAHNASKTEEQAPLGTTADKCWCSSTRTRKRTSKADEYKQYESSYVSAVVRGVLSCETKTGDKIHSQLNGRSVAPIHSSMASLSDTFFSAPREGRSWEVKVEGTFFFLFDPFFF